MRKSLLIIAVAIIAFSCGGQKTVDREAVMSEIGDKFRTIATDSTLTEEEAMAKIRSLLADSYEEHRKDSVGIDIFQAIAAYGVPETVIELYESSEPIVKEDEGVISAIGLIRNQLETGEGKQYVEIAGPEAITGSNTCLSEMLAQGKPVLVDFFASWCSPCRNEIENRLKALAAEGKVNILGVAVWEQSIDDTKNVIEKLGITWPVVYTCDLEESPSEAYGVSAVPTLLLVDPSGKIIARGHSTEEFEDKLTAIK